MGVHGHGSHGGTQQLDGSFQGKSRPLKWMMTGATHDKTETSRKYVGFFVGQPSLDPSLHIGSMVNQPIGNVIW